MNAGYYLSAFSHFIPSSARQNRRLCGCASVFLFWRTGHSGFSSPKASNFSGRTVGFLAPPYRPSGWWLSCLHHSLYDRFPETLPLHRICEPSLHGQTVWSVFLFTFSRIVLLRSYSFFRCKVNVPLRWPFIAVEASVALPPIKQSEIFLYFPVRKT